MITSTEHSSAPPTRRAMAGTRILALLLAFLPHSTSAATLPDSVEVSRKPGLPWTAMPTRTLDALPEIPVDAPGNRFGGYPKRFAQPTGFFRTARSGNRWWLVDPDGSLFIHRGVTSIRQTPTPAGDRSLRQLFGTPEGWAASTATLLRDHGFNGFGAWCDDPVLRPAKRGLVYTKLWNFMSTYGKKRGGTYRKPGHTGYPGGCPFIFDPQFPEFCDRHARQLAAFKDDPWLLGHFTDNELPWNTEMLGNYLKLPEDDPGHLAALRWLRKRHGNDASTADITSRDREDFVGYAAHTYFGIVTKAIRRHDPNHLVLGSRFHGRALRSARLFEAAGRHLDVISVNYYHAWTPDAERLAGWASGSGKPILITEWYAKAVDSGMGNTSGAGWLVKTQTDRAAFYQNFTLGLLESHVCVGWHWFRYSDNDPGQKGADPSNLDANKGIVTNRYKPYQALLDAMKEVNLRTFGIIRHFDHTSSR